MGHMRQGNAHYLTSWLTWNMEIHIVELVGYHGYRKIHITELVGGTGNREIHITELVGKLEKEKCTLRN